MRTISAELTALADWLEDIAQRTEVEAFSRKALKLRNLAARCSGKVFVSPVIRRSKVSDSFIAKIRHKTLPAGRGPNEEGALADLQRVLEERGAGP